MWSELDLGQVNCKGINAEWVDFFIHADFIWVVSVYMKGFISYLLNTVLIWVILDAFKQGNFYTGEGHYAAYADVNCH